jgi:serine/threonine-protein kinase RsbW
MAKNADVNGSHVVSLTVPAEPKWLALCRLVLSGLCQLQPVDDETLADLKLAVTEACSNSVRHAYGEDGSGAIRVRYALEQGAVTIEVADTGRGFRFDQPLPDLAALPEEELREDEMGLAIINALVDEVDIGAGPDGRGTRIRLVKYIGTGPNGAG